ncbi:MAG: hypothetical protein ACK4HV_08865, partial [Parachlamydiaceae bacterium]
APASHFHNIENIWQEEVQVIDFFNSSTTDYIGIAEVTGEYSNEELSAIFNVNQAYLQPLSKIQEPLVIVPV